MQLSVITATRKRPQLLSLCLAQFQRQSIGNLLCEQIVVADGPDPTAAALARDFGARFIELPQPRGRWGAFAKDAGIAAAASEYVCFWDDDNEYAPHALATLYSAALGADIGVVQTWHYQAHAFRLIPPAWKGRFEFSQVDTMCVCVRRSLARAHPWGDDDPRPGTDFRWLTRLQAAGATIRFVPLTIGRHL